MSRVRIVAFAIFFAVTSAAFSQQATPRKRTITGEVRLHAGVRSQILNNARDIMVWLPPDYAREPGRRYPVLYMGDGQNLFNLETSFLPDQEWRVDEIATAMVEARLVEPVIIVGVYNAGMDRANEYLPTRVRDNGGRVDRFGRFLVEEVKPMIDRTYRTKKGAGDTGLAGSSFGGIMTLSVGMRYPNVFGKLAVMSPSVWWDDRRILKLVDALPSKPRQRVWVDIGTEEGDDSVANAALLRDRLVAKGWREGKDLAFVTDRGAKHNENAWAGRMDAILMWLFPKR
ncbi:MAG: alpha/beta hydrolase [Fimbriimonas sp.]